MCSSGLGWVSQAWKPETLALPICESWEEEWGVGGLGTVHNDSNDRTDRRLSVVPILAEKDPLSAQTSSGPQ